MIKIELQDRTIQLCKSKSKLIPILNSSLSKSILKQITFENFHQCLTIAIALQNDCSAQTDLDGPENIWNLWQTSKLLQCEKVHSFLTQKMISKVKQVKANQLTILSELINK